MTGKSKGQKEFDVTIFHQKYNPQTSVESLFSALKISSLSDVFALFSQKGLAILAFMLILFVFVLNTSLCPDSKIQKMKAEMIAKEALIPGEELATP